jgi:hypothetical protein
VSTGGTTTSTDPAERSVSSRSKAASLSGNLQRASACVVTTSSADSSTSTKPPHEFANPYARRRSSLLASASHDARRGRLQETSGMREPDERVGELLWGDRDVEMLGAGDLLHSPTSHLRFVGRVPVGIREEQVCARDLVPSRGAWNRLLEVSERNRRVGFVNFGRRYLPGDPADPLRAKTSQAGPERFSTS